MELLKDTNWEEEVKKKFPSKRGGKKKQRKFGLNPRALGTNPRKLGTNPRKKGKKRKKLKRSALQKMTYLEYISSFFWKKRRSEFLKRYGNRCVACDVTKRIIVHHMTYRHLKKERDEELAPLCWDCHGEYHRTYPKPSVKTTLLFIRERQQEEQQNFINSIN